MSFPPKCVDSRHTNSHWVVLITESISRRRQKSETTKITPMLADAQQETQRFAQQGFRPRQKSPIRCS